MSKKFIGKKTDVEQQSCFSDKIELISKVNLQLAGQKLLGKRCFTGATK